MDIQLINDKLLTDLHEKAKVSERKRMNFDLRTTTEDTSQRMINVLEPGTLVTVHRHDSTTETIICIEGCLDVVLLEEMEDKRLVEKQRIRLCPKEAKYGVQLPVKAWHTVEVYEPSTIFEAKDGKYIP